MLLLIALIVLALILGGVGLAVHALYWLLIVGAVVLVAALVLGVVRRGSLGAGRTRRRL